ncbi:WD repeat-containing protein 25 [Nephila pilipes]|uniref:WD repeat-containing protein 25 n=1 Tax=Nephila pilipes TaxID=299642 RepID=A0A8X6NBW9_NEPPI|nr:WD repeat-containing protein 25 [Nephila pilipes]
MNPLNRNDEGQKSSKDSDIIDIVYEKAVTEVECICLDDSDSETKNQVSSESSRDDVIVLSSSSHEKIDYLHLDSSDTDDEQENIQNSVNNLLNSAAILNDIDCGPTKPPTPGLTNIVLPLSEDNPSREKRPYSPSKENSDVRNNNHPSYIDITGESSNGSSSKRLKLNSPNTDNALSCETEEKDPRASMYRRDPRIKDLAKEKIISHIPTELNKIIEAHEKSVSSLSWCALSYSHLFLSSSLDCTVKLWDMYSCEKPLNTFKLDLPVRAAVWSKTGEEVIAGGFGKKAHVFDALSGREYIKYDVYNNVSSIAIHPYMEDVFLCGTENAILGFDLRVNSKLPVRTFLDKFGEVMDIAFLNKNDFVCTTSDVGHDSGDRTIMVWDFNSGSILSNQIYLERYSCPSLKVNRQDSSFVVQSNGDYLAAFSSRKPYKVRNMRFTGHKVCGYAVECDISADGKYVASGDAGGSVYFYNYADASQVGKLTIKADVPTNRLRFHPVLPSTMAVATWDGQIHLWK